MFTRRASIAAAVLASGAIVAGAAHAATPILHIDPLGDSKSAPDVVAVGLTDNGDGTVSGDIGLAAPFSGHEIVYMAFDTDSNSATGLNGAEYVAAMSFDSSALARWDGTALTPFKAVPSTLNASGVLHFTISLADIGSPTAFGYWAGSINGNDSDQAPDTGEYGYPLTVNTFPTAPAQTVRSVVVGAASLVPKAGRLFTVPLPKVRLSDDEIVPADSATCTLSWKGKALRPVRACAWNLPVTLRKKQLVLKLSVAYHGTTQTVTLPVSPR
jgi:hypothetical protein